MQRVKDVLHPRLDLLERGVDEVLEDGQRGQPDVVVDTRQPQQQPACKKNFSDDAQSLEAPIDILSSGIGYLHKKPVCYEFLQ